MVNELKMVNTFWKRHPISFKHVFLVSVLGATPHHILLKYRCLLKISNQIRHVYFKCSHAAWHVKGLAEISKARLWMVQNSVVVSISSNYHQTWSPPPLLITFSTLLIKKMGYGMIYLTVGDVLITRIRMLLRPCSLSVCPLQQTLKTSFGKLNEVIGPSLDIQGSRHQPLIVS